MYGYVYSNRFVNTNTKKLQKLQIITSARRMKKSLKIYIETKENTGNKKTKEDIIKRINDIPGILRVELHEVNNKPENRKINNNETRKLYLFFDVDGTLTEKGVKDLIPQTRYLFQQLRAKHCIMYFCSGRSVADVERLTKDYNIGPGGIAENGGIIFNIGSDHRKRGEKTNPNEFVKYLKDRNLNYELDLDQGTRETEIILLKDSIKFKIIKENIKKSKIKIECNQSHNTYHISKLGINKKSAINYLRDIWVLNADQHKLIGVGDSELDIHMFSACDENYFIGQPNKCLKSKLIKEEKSGMKIKYLKPLDPLKQLYHELFPF